MYSRCFISYHKIRIIILYIQAMKTMKILLLVVVSYIVCVVTGDEVIQGASDLEMKSNDTVGEDMFEISGGKDKTTKIKFGFFKIVELTSNGTVIETDKHSCNFRNDSITCTTSKEEVGGFPAVDELGENVEANYTRITKTCDLSPCNSNPSAKLLVRSYIMLNKAYICQPSCEAEDQYQSPVFNGTAKWEIEVSDWNFCADDDCDGEVASDMKFFFALRGSKGGKDMKPKGKSKAAFDKLKGKFAEKCLKKFGEGDKNETSGAITKRDAAEKPDRENKGKPRKGDRKGKGKCRNSLFSSFTDEPDDQKSFAFADDDGSEANTVVRMFGMAVADDTDVIANGTGFVGPNLETAEETVGESEENKNKTYMTIQVPMFGKKIVYDPTVDMDSTGGSNGDLENSVSGLIPCHALTICTAVFLCLQGLVDRSNR